MVMAAQRAPARGPEVPRTTNECGPRLLAPWVSRPRVLVAEDDDVFQALLRDELGRAGLEVVSCTSASEAVRQREWIDAMAGDPWSLDVVVTDLRLGEIDGLALLQRVAEAGVDVPVVMISGFGDVGARLRAGRLGAAAFLDKPVAMDRLRSLVHKLARERQRRVRAKPQGVRPGRWRGRES